MLTKLHDLRSRHQIEIRKRQHRSMIEKKRRFLEHQEVNMIPCGQLIDSMPQSLDKICLLTRMTNPEMLLQLYDHLSDICGLLPTLSLDHWFLMCQILSDMIDYRPPIISYFQQEIAKKTHSVMLFKGWNFMHQLKMFRNDIQESIFMLFSSVCKFLTVISLQDIAILSIISRNKLSRFDQEYSQYEQIAPCIHTLNIIFGHNDQLDDQYDPMAKQKIQIKQLKYRCFKQTFISNPLALKTLILTIQCRTDVLSLLTNLLYNAHANSFKRIFLEMDMLPELAKIINGPNSEEDRIIAMKAFNNFLQIAQKYQGDFNIVPFFTDACSRQHGELLFQALQTFYVFLQADQKHLRQYIRSNDLTMFISIFSKMQYYPSIIDLAVQFFLFILNKIAQTPQIVVRVSDSAQMLQYFYANSKVQQSTQLKITTALQLARYIQCHNT